MYKIPNEMPYTKYQFVTLASKRAEQLQMGALPRVEGGSSRKLTVVAQEEVARGFVGVWAPEAETVLEEAEEE